MPNEKKRRECAKGEEKTFPLTTMEAQLVGAEHFLERLLRHLRSEGGEELSRRPEEGESFFPPICRSKTTTAYSSMRAFSFFPPSSSSSSFFSFPSASRDRRSGQWRRRAELKSSLLFLLAPLRARRSSPHRPTTRTRERAKRGRRREAREAEEREEGSYYRRTETERGRAISRAVAVVAI